MITTNKTQELHNLIPNRSNYINRYRGTDYIYTIHVPALDLVKIGLSRRNPWERIRTVVKSVSKKHPASASEALAVDLSTIKYVVMSGGYHQEQDIHERLKTHRTYQQGLASPTEWFNYAGLCEYWFDQRYKEQKEANKDSNVFGNRRSLRDGLGIFSRSSSNSSPESFNRLVRAMD